MKVAIYIDDQTFIGQAGTWDEAEEAAMLVYAHHMDCQLAQPDMQGDEDQAFLKAEADAARYQGLVHLDDLVADGIAKVVRLEGPMD